MSVNKVGAGGPEWRALVDAAKRALEEQRLTLERVPGRGLSNVWRATGAKLNGDISIRTTRDRWFAFPPLHGGTVWKTLDDVQWVVVAAVDSVRNPRNVEVYLSSARDVRKRFSEAYAARTAKEHVVRDDFGMWINLDRDGREPYSAGSGLANASLRPRACSQAEKSNALQLPAP